LTPQRRREEKCTKKEEILKEKLLMFKNKNLLQENKINQLNVIIGEKITSVIKDSRRRYA